MTEISTREFTRNFARYRARAAEGETIRVSSPEGSFLFKREPSGLPVGEFLERLEELPSAGVFDEGGGKAIRSARRSAKAARNPWH